MEDFKPISGSCICGEIEYTIKSKPLFTHACHCKDCKKITGSSFVVNTSIFENSLDIKGELLEKKLIAGSGKKLQGLLLQKVWCLHLF